MKVKRLLSLVLVLSMLVQIAPVSAMATDENHIAPPEAAETVAAEEEPADTEPEETEEAPAEEGTAAADAAETVPAEEPEVIGEVTELREEYVKHFRNSDGSFTAVGYNSPVHYKETENGDWEEIDNTLSLQTTKDGRKTVTEYAPKASPMKVRFAKETGGNLASMENQGHTLSWYYEFGSKARSVSSPIAAKKIDKAELAPTELKKDSRKEKFRADKISDGLRYSEITADVDLEYILSSASLKENLILQSKNAPSGYTIVYEIGELTAEQTTPQEITLKDDAGEIIFVISAPCMVDANMEESTDVTLTVLSQGSGNMRVRLNADEEWLQAEEREYPVTIDPYIVKEMKVSSYNGYASYIQYDAGYGYDSGGLLVGNDNYTWYGQAQSYIKFPLPTLLSGDIVVGSKMHLYQMAGDDGYSTGDITSSLQVNVYQVKSSWTRQDLIDSAKMEGLPSRDTTVIDYKKISQKSSGGYVTFDITEVVKMWYNGTENYGVCLRANDTTQNDRARFMANQNDVDPCLEVTYLNNKGLEGRWTTHNQDLGESGMGYVNDYTGNLVFIAPLTGTTGNRMPVSLSLVYNGYQHGDDVDRPYTVGKGWRLNIHEKITPITSGSTGLMGDLYESGYRYVYEDADGTDHYFYAGETSGEYVDEEGLGLTLTINSTVTDLEKYVLKSDDGGKKTFTSSGLLRKIYDDNGNFAKLFYSEAEGESGQVFKVEDGSGRAIYINRTDGGVTSITDPAGRITELFYEDGLLKRIKYPDEISTYFYYTSSGLRLNYVLARNGTRIHYKYPSAGNEADISRVVEVMEYDSTGDSVSDAEDGNKLEMDYDELNQTTFTLNETRTEVYQFDNYGRTVAIKDAVGNVGQYTYQSGETISKKANTLTSATVAPQYVGNLLRDHSFEQSISKWGVTEGSVTISTNHHYLGDKSLYLQDGVDAWQKYVPSPGSTYTFSAYVRTSNSTVCPKLNVYFYDSSGYMGDEYYVESETIAYTSSVWNRIHVTFSVPTGTEYIYVRCATTGEGTAWFDCVQLENSSTVNPYNMLENGGFNREDSAVWEGYETTSSDKVYYTDSGDGYFWMGGSASARKRIVQTVYVNRTANKTFFNLRATAKGNSVPLTSDSRKFALSLTAVYEDGTESSTKYVNFNPDYDETQVAAGTIGFNSSETIKKVYVRCEYAYNANDVWFDSVQVTIDESGSSYTYDDDGNLITAKDNAARKQAYTYNNAGDMLTAKDAENKQYTFNYSSTYKHRLLSAVAESADLKFSFGYDDYGNVESQTVRALDADGNATGKYIKKYTYYTDNGAYPATVYSDRGYATTYTYNNSKGTLTKSVDPRDYTLNYTYNANNDRLTKVTDGTSTVEYTYNIRGRLTTVETDSTTYSFSYDAFGNNTLVKAGGKKLVENEYNDNNGTLSKATYGNGDYINYYYDSLDRVTSVAYNGYTKHKWNYNANGQVGRYKDYVSGKTYDYTYDGIGRLIRTNVSDGSRIRAYYNTMDQLSEIHYRFADNGGKDVYYTYSLNDNQQLSVSFGSNSAYQVQSRYDSLRRLDHNTLITPDEDVADVDVYYSYHDRSTDEYRTTSLVKGIDYQYVSGGLSIHDPYYKYDSTGNITSEWVWDSGDTTGAQKERYVYSTSGQLTRHDSATQNKSFTYSYDEAGNLLTKRTYAYTTGTLGSSTDSVTYAYSTGTWGDLLTAYDGKSITYDEMGNMKTFDGATFTWQGRQLSSRAKNGTTTTYKYNSDGIRTSKTVGSTKTEYFLNGSQILAQKAGDNVMWFFYDANGTRVGLISNGYMFYYLYNLQGDVIALVRASTGQIVAKYTYDAWGKCTTTNLDGWTVGTRNPFRYRGYYYDSESGLYYLNSRYYNPELGRFISPDTTAILTATPAALTDKNLYAYCDNNPVMRRDDGGTFWNIAAGAAIGGAISAGTQIATNLITGEKWSSGLGSAIITGAASGALAATGVGLVGQVLGNAAISGISETANQYKSGTLNSIEGAASVAVATFLGGVSGRIGGNGIRHQSGNYYRAAVNARNTATKVFSKQYSNAYTPNKLLRYASNTVRRIGRRESIITGVKFFAGTANSQMWMRGWQAYVG